VPHEFLRALRASASGFRQKNVAGDHWQQGGVLIFAPGGVEVYRHVSAAAGDQPDLDDVLHTIRVVRL